MMDSSKMDTFWEDPPPGGMSHGSHGQHLPYERNLNFSTVAIEDSEYGFPKKKTVRDPLSHRIIEKRRRDRMNNCLADLARLLPPSSLRKGRGRIEKTEIVELAIKHLRHLQCHPCPQSDNCEYSRIPTPSRNSSSSHPKSSSLAGSSSSSCSDATQGSSVNPEEHFRMGFQESMSEMMHFLVEHEGMYAGDDMCVRLVKHLNNHCESLLQNYIGNKRKMTLGFTGGNSRMASSMGKKTEDGSISSGYQPHGSSGSGSDEMDLQRDGYGSGGFGGKSYTGTPHNLSNITGSGNQESLVTVTPFDYEGDQNSCSSAQLSIEISDAYSQDGKMCRPLTKPPIPVMIGSHSSSNNRDVSNECVGSSGSPPVNSSNSDEGNSTITSASSPSNHRYKFKNKIKQRFAEGLQTSGTRHDGDDDERRKNNQSRQSQYDGGDGPDGGDLRSPQPSGNETDNPGDNYDDTIPIPVESEQPSSKRTKENTSNGSSNNSSSVVQLSKRIDSDGRRHPDPLEEDEETEKASSSCKRAESPVEKKPITVELLVPPILTTSSPMALPLPSMVAAGLHADTKALGVCGPTEVPAFALHEKGLFYVPLTIDKSIVAPFIKTMDQNTQPPLHPVTISVCFLLSTDGKKIPAVPVTKPLVSPMPIHVAAASPSIYDPSDVHHPPQVDIIREPNSFIMNRFAQSQVPMIFGSSAAAVAASSESSTFSGPCKLETANAGIRYPFSLASSSISSHGSTSGSSDPAVKLYHQNDNNRSGHFGSSTSSGSGGGDGGASLTINAPASTSSGIHRNRKRSISNSSPSLGYQSWNDKSSSEAEAYIHGPLPLPPGGGPAARISGAGSSLEVIEEVHHSHNNNPSLRASFGSHVPHKAHPTVSMYPADQQSSSDRDLLRASREVKAKFQNAKRSRKGRTEEGGSGGSYRQSVSSI